MIRAYDNTHAYIDIESIIDWTITPYYVTIITVVYARYNFSTPASDRELDSPVIQKQFTSPTIVKEFESLTEQKQFTSPTIVKEFKGLVVKRQFTSPART